MLTFKDLQNKVYYRGRECVRFECTVPMNEERQVLATFKRMNNPNEWNLQIVFDRTRDKVSEGSNFGYIMPRSGLPLELIAATGLKYFQLYLKEENQTKSNLDFELGRILEGM